MSTTQLYLFPSMVSQTQQVPVEYSEPAPQAHAIPQELMRVQYLTILKIANRMAKGRPDARDYATDLGHQAWLILHERHRKCPMDWEDYRWTRNLRSIFRDARVRLGGGRKGWVEPVWCEYDEERHWVEV